jgi:hypothetical protein
MKKLTSIVTVFAFFLTSNIISAQQPGNNNYSVRNGGAQAARSGTSTGTMAIVAVGIAAAVAGIAVAVSSNSGNGHSH